jgi:uncharacterized protein YkuJ
MKSENFVSEESKNIEDTYIVMYDVKKNLGENLLNTSVNYLYPKNNSSRDGDIVDTQLFFRTEQLGSVQHLESEGIIYELRQNELYLNNDSQVDTSDVFSPGEFLIQIAYNGAHGIWILTTFNKIYSYTPNEGFIEYTEHIDHVKQDPPLLISGNMYKQDSLYYITTKGSLYNIYSNEPILDYKNGEFVLRVSQYKNSVAFITSSYQIYIYDEETNTSKPVARASNSLLTVNATHVFYVKEIESEHVLYKFNFKVEESKEEPCLYGELRPGTGLGGGGISDVNILETMKSGNIVAYVLNQKLECSKTQNYVDFIDKNGKKTCVCKEHYFRSEDNNNTCIPCKKTQKRLNTSNTELTDGCEVLTCHVKYTNASSDSIENTYVNNENKYIFDDIDRNEFNVSRQTDPNYKIISFDNTEDELCSTFVYGGSKFSEHSPYIQLTDSGYIFREEDYIKTLTNDDIKTYPSLSNMAKLGETNTKGWKIDEIDQRAIIQDEINGICFENTALSSVLDKADLCPRPEKSTAKCPFDSLLFEDKACQKVPPGAVIDTENEPIYDSLANGHRITKYNECPANTFANKDECTPCDPGTFAPPMSTECTECGPGSILNETKDGCADCPAGTFMSTENTVKPECVSCPEGEVSNARSVSCYTCKPGETPSENQDMCVKCSNNTYNTDGLKCLQCEGGVNEKATECIKCDESYEKVVPGRGCERCPSGQRATTHPNQRNCVPDCDLMIYRDDGTRFHIQPREFGYNTEINLESLLRNGERINIYPPLNGGNARMNLTVRDECAIDTGTCQINTNIIDGQEWHRGGDGDHSIGWYTKNLKRFKFTNKINKHECDLGASEGRMVKDRPTGGGTNKGH